LKGVEHSDGGGDVAFEAVLGEIYESEVGVEVAREGSGEVGVGDGQGFEFGHVGEDDEGARGFDLDVGDS